MSRNSATYHRVYIMWLTCGGKPQVHFHRQLGALPYTTHCTELSLTIHDVTADEGLAKLYPDVASQPSITTTYQHGKSFPSQTFGFVNDLDRTSASFHNLVDSFRAKREFSLPTTLSFENFADYFAHCQQASVVIARRDE